MLDRKLRVGVIGLGGIGRSEHLPHWRTCPDAELAAIADGNPETLDQVGKQYPSARRATTWRELVEMKDLDVVDVATPNKWHAPMAIAALEAGKHVLCEKPMATNAADAARMLQAARKSGKTLMVNQHLRFSPTLRSLRRLAKDGGLGEVYHAHARWNRRRGVPNSRTFTSLDLAGGGPILDLGVHMLDLALWFMEFPTPTSVFARCGVDLARRQDLGGMWGDHWDREHFEVEDGGVGLFRFHNGATLLLEANWISFQQQLETRDLHVYGTKGGAHWPDCVYVTEKDRTPIDSSLVSKEDGKPHQRSIHEFAAAVRAGKPVPVPAEQSVQISRMIDAFYRSAKECREVAIDGRADRREPAS